MTSIACLGSPRDFHGFAVTRHVVWTLTLFGNTGLPVLFQNSIGADCLGNRRLAGDTAWQRSVVDGSCETFEGRPGYDASAAAEQRQLAQVRANALFTHGMFRYGSSRASLAPSSWRRQRRRFSVVDG